MDRSSGGDTGVGVVLHAASPAEATDRNGVVMEELLLGSALLSELELGVEKLREYRTEWNVLPERKVGYPIVVSRFGGDGWFRLQLTEHGGVFDIEDQTMGEKMPLPIWQKLVDYVDDLNNHTVGEEAA